MVDGPSEDLFSWRAVILYGLNTATYKLALARCLAEFARQGKDRVSQTELATAFLDTYVERLEAGRPQLLRPGRQTVMERVVSSLNAGVLDRDAAIDRVANDAFGDVIPRFHTVANVPVPVQFYESTADGLTLTDAAFRLFADADTSELDAELDARWSLLEAAFEQKRIGGELATDVRAVYLVNGYERRSITGMRPVLHGYQVGRCFYCGEPIPPGEGDVDHVIPRQFLHHDEPWNLVLAHAFCNQQKSDALPGERYLEQLVIRNEHLISSNHPLKRHLIAQLGTTADQRRRKVARVYSDAQLAIPYTWEGLRGADPVSDPLYRAIVRRLSR